MIRYLGPFLSAGVVVLIGFHVDLHGRQEAVSASIQATQAQKVGLDEITEGRVTATISFLASDELEYRSDSR